MKHFLMTVAILVQMSQSAIAQEAFSQSVFAKFSNDALSDVYSGGKFAKDYPEYVHITINDDHSATFEFCQAPGGINCHLLGNKIRYPLRDLREREARLRHDMNRTIAADAATVLGTALAGTIALAASPTPIGWVTIGMVATSGAATSMIGIFRGNIAGDGGSIDAKYKKAKTLDDEVLSTQAVYLNEPITTFAERLDALLKGIL